MKILLIQLSDIHFKVDNNSVLEKEVKLFESIRNSTLNFDKLYLIVTGDSAYSGKIEEYDIASKFLENLKAKLVEYTKKDIECIIIPGNHDCDFEKDDKSRQNQINIIQKLGDSAIDDSVIEQCTKVQENYSIFEKSLHGKPIFANKLLTVFQYDLVGGKQIVFYCYNTSYLSEIKEQAGKMFFPTSQIPESVYNIKADLFISLFHHPFHWLNPTNRREFATHIQETSDFYLTGHEHEFSKSQIDDLDENIVYHIEGCVLQDSENRFESAFNLIGFDLNSESFKIEKFFWNDDRYTKSGDTSEWINYKRGKLKWKNKYNITSTFAKFLDDIGGKFTHPNKSDIKLQDLFIYPKLRYFNTKESSEDHISFVVANSESVIKNLKTDSKILLFGGENIGKTSLLKISYRVLYQAGYIPVYIDGHEISSSGIDDFKKLITKSFCNQYGENSLEDFSQEDVGAIFILIDDIDKNPLKNQKAKGRFIKALNEHYKNILLIGNELFAIEEIVSDEEVKGDLYSTFEQYEILEFNHSLRVKLIQRWYTLGKEDFITDEELWKKCDNAVKAISIAMGYRIVPNYPIFLLILLQAVETSNPHDLQISSYGNYYQLLILKAFTETIKDQANLNTYQNYCSELAFLFFEKKANAISDIQHLDFHKTVTSYEKYDLPRLSQEQALLTLEKVGVIQRFGDIIEFKYRYTYYYFVAKYLAQNIDKKETKEIIEKLTKRLYRTEFANILMFLIHFSRSEFIIEQLINNAKDIFKELAPCKLEDDVQQINSLVIELPKLYLKSKSVDEVRDEENNKIDKAEEEEPKEEHDEIRKSWDLDEDISEIDIVSRLNLSFKLMETLGQILKNNYGSMTGPQKNSALKETYLMGLRTLNIFFEVFNNNTDFILNQLKESLSKFKKVSEDKIEKTARHLLFALSTQISFVFIKKIADSIGSNKLMEKYPKIQEELDFDSVKLINYLIKLEQSRSFPGNELGEIKQSLEKHQLSYFLLRRMVVNHLHRHPIDYKDKQRVCQFLGIPMESQLRIEAERKKRTGEEKKDK